MKIVIALVCLIFTTACIHSKKTYELPEAMLPHVKVEYELRCQKGYYLYKANCGSCHDFKIRNKTYTPDFTPDQLQGYSIRISNARHETAMPDSLVSEEELALICNYLNYKIKNSPAVQKQAGSLSKAGQ